jgi:hypothetical protein
MFTKQKLLIALTLSMALAAFTVPSASAKPNEYDLIVRHLQSKYQAKKVNIPVAGKVRGKSRAAGGIQEL